MMGKPAAQPHQDVIRTEDGYFVRASSSLADDRTRVLKHGETFALFNRYGDVQPVGRGEQGIYVEGTRHLSRLELRVGGERPLLLSSTVTEDNASAAIDLTNPRLDRPGGSRLDQDLVHLFRTAVVWERVFHQSLQLRSYALEIAEFEFSLDFAADFADIFEVRGVERVRRGRLLPAEVEGDHVVFAYEGLDGVIRRTVLRFSPAPTAIDSESAHFWLRLDPRADQTLFLAAMAERGEARAQTVSYRAAAEAVRTEMAPRATLDLATTSNEQFNDWLNRSAADLRMMLTDSPEGLYPYAGVPWFSAPFGRDGIITALETLWADPSIAAGVLRLLAATQADAEDPESDAEPGKILHEARGGEMAALGEVPFRRYYGSVDATPLFIVLAEAYYERTGDITLVETLWPHVRRALDWMANYGDPDGDGFLEYTGRAGGGLRNQGWKDSADSVFHADGALADDPIALCEVQAYAFAAKQAAAKQAAVLGDDALAKQLRGEARQLRHDFHEAFWLEDLGTYALALDRDKRPCRVRTSNAGHCLFAGIAMPKQARRLAAALLDEASFSGWGVRTLAPPTPRYNPMSYHNGSVWPHDNALIAAGLARYGLKDAALRVMTGLFDASLFLDLHRMPELFCGFPRRPGEGPTLYPVACAPQAWASGAVFLLLQACLGLRVSALERRLVFANPTLPCFLGRVEMRGLRIGGALVDLEFTRHPEDVGLQVVRREGDVEVVVVK